MRCRRRLSSVAWLLVGVLSAACDGGDPPQPEDSAAGVPALVAYDPLPADMGQWTCEEYRRALAGSNHESTLLRLLDVRPHAWQVEARREDLVDLPREFVASSRSDPVIYRHQVHAAVAPSLVELLRAADSAGLALRVQSPYRSPGYQNLLWKRAVARYQSDLVRAAFRVAPPCFSEHASGRAVDFSAETGPGPVRFADTEEFRWLRDNAGRWGWEQSFRDDTGAVDSPTRQGILIEPWHFRHQSLRASGPGDREAFQEQPGPD